MSAKLVTLLFVDYLEFRFHNLSIGIIDQSGDRAIGAIIDNGGASQHEACASMPKRRYDSYRANWIDDVR